MSLHQQVGCMVCTRKQLPVAAEVDVYYVGKRNAMCFPVRPYFKQFSLESSNSTFFHRELQPTADSHDSYSNNFVTYI